MKRIPTASNVILSASLITLGSLILYLRSLVGVYRDAEARGKEPLLVVLLVALVAWPLGLFVRPEE